MIKYFLITLCILNQSFFYNVGFCSEKQLTVREKQYDNRTSVVIPCHYSHFELLEELLSVFCYQSTLPNEVVISLSESQHIERVEIDNLRNISWPFALQIICSNEKKTAGENRNIACEHASGDLLICIDADDIPHPEWIEIIKYFFDNYQIELMLHKFIRTDEAYLLNEHIEYNSNTLDPCFLEKYSYLLKDYLNVTNGHPSLLKSVFEKVKWDPAKIGEDVLFVYDVLDQFENVVAIKAKLTLYRREYSTWKKPPSEAFKHRSERFNEELFTAYYHKNKGKFPSLSGSGSDVIQTKQICEIIPLLLQSIGCSTLVDIGCGDFYWLRNIDLPVEKYIGVDIVKEIIESNQINYENQIYSFKHLDVIKTVIPKADVVLCRDLLVKFSYSEISKVIKNLKESGSRYLLVTTFTNRKNNSNIQSRSWCPYNFSEAPFFFPDPLEIIIEGCTEGNGNYSDKSLALWEIDSLPTSFD